MRADEIRATLSDTGDWPVPVKAWRVERGEDAAGGEAVFVWATLEEALADPEARSTIRRKVRDLLSNTLGPRPPWVYVRFRDEAEPEPETV